MAGDQVPEGQLPRDSAFWRTHHAVLAERDQAERRAWCRDHGHWVKHTQGLSPVCDRCDLTGDELMVDAGYRRTETGWAYP